MFPVVVVGHMEEGEGNRHLDFLKAMGRVKNNRPTGEGERL